MNVQDEKLVLFELLKAFSLSLDLICNPIEYDTERGLSCGNEDMIEIAELEKEENPERGRSIIEELVVIAGDIKAHFKDYQGWKRFRESLLDRLDGSESRYYALFKD